MPRIVYHRGGCHLSWAGGSPRRSVCPHRRPVLTDVLSSWHRRCPPLMEPVLFVKLTTAGHGAVGCPRCVQPTRAAAVCRSGVHRDAEQASPQSQTPDLGRTAPLSSRVWMDGAGVPEGTPGQLGRRGVSPSPTRPPGKWWEPPCPTPLGGEHSPWRLLPRSFSLWVWVSPGRSCTWTSRGREHAWVPAGH